jgi:O6-methylguanine-DNA--protein-cysteine methyltransferase
MGSSKNPPYPGYVCSVPGCGRTDHQAHGRCKRCDTRWRRHGDATVVKPPNRPPSLKTYGSVHGWLWRQLGTARDHVCVDCGKQASDWSYNHGCPDEMSNDPEHKGLPFCPHLEHYSARCRSCHDRKDDKRKARGEDAGKAKLTESDVRWLRAQPIGERLTYRELAEILGVSHTAVRHAYLGITWKHVT